MDPKAKVLHYTEIPSQVFGPSAPGASIRWLIDDDHDGAPTFSLRMIEIEPGGSSPHHIHPYEHENFIVEGQGSVLIGDISYDLKVGDIAFVPPNTMHQYSNTGSTPFKFLCGIPIKALMKNNC
jgi:quercetin dioxygenase-like cupin family protein